MSGPRSTGPLLPRKGGPWTQAEGTGIVPANATTGQTMQYTGVYGPLGANALNAAPLASQFVGGSLTVPLAQIVTKGDINLPDTYAGGTGQFISIGQNTYDLSAAPAGTDSTAFLNYATGQIQYYLQPQGPLTAFSDHHQQNYPSYNGAGLSLTGINLSQANLASANFSSADLTSANLSGANVYLTNFTSANLTNANLQNPDVRVAITAAQLQSAASVQGANLSGNNLSGFDLHGLNFSGANFASANLTGASLASANLSGTMFTSATLTGANLDHASLPAALPMLPVINGAVVTLHGTLTVSGQTQVDSGGTLSLDHASTLNTSGLTLPSGSTLSVELAGLTAGSQYSQLNISGTATLGGTLDVALASGYGPSPSNGPLPGDQFQLFNGSLQNTFSTVVLPPLLPGEFWNQSHLYSAGVLSVGGVVGDLNGDGVVNGLDISLISSYWLRVGQGLPADANGDGVVNGLAIALVSSNWLQTAVSGAGSGTTSVPEPSSIILAAVGVVALLACRRRLAR